MTGKRKSGKIRLTILMAAVSLSLLSLTGCHGSKGRAEFEVPKELDESRTFEITFWAKNDTNKTQTEIYQEAVRRFEEYYPNIHVNVRLYTNYGDIYNDVITNIATETTPNVCITYPDHIATYLTGSNTVVPLDSLFEDSRYGLGGKKVAFESVKRDEIVPEFLEECTIGENIYAIPFMRSTEACYVNQTYVEKLGYELPEVLTWDFVWEVSEAAMKKDAKGNFVVNGQNVMIPFIYKSTDNMMIQMLRQKDWGYSDESGEIQIFNDQTASLLKTIAEHGKTKAFSTFKISSYPANFLNAGQCIFAVDSTAGATWMGSEAPLMDISADKVVSFKTAVRMVPQFDPEHPQMISQGPSVCVFNKADPQEVLASWLFAQYLLTEDVQIAFSGTVGYVPVTLKARNTQEYQDYLAKEGQDRKEHYDVQIKATKLLWENTQPP
ncbi:MAG: carbohydrate ABC transporter substrate-binding protein, partial [Lachnospiraceae bacterium]|nr:carbohydrate ABC transporter substrate-binding protein [Lachnospiraceae bacterium]